MSRRSGRKVDIVPSDPKVDVVSKPAAAEKVGKKSPRKKDRTPVNEERVVITATSVKSEVVQAKRAENSEATNSVTETLVVIEADKSPGKRRIKNEGIKNHISTESRESPTKVKAKPKREAEIGGEGDEEVDVQKIKKRRKTKEEKEAEAMPLATRTSVQTLKRAMYIGAHVSGAGGKSFHVACHPLPRG
jgi:AP endonuclease-1